MSTITFKIEGMTCNHCKMSVEKALSQIPGIESFSVNLEPGIAVVSGNPDRQLVIDEINKLGYNASLAP